VLLIVSVCAHGEYNNRLYHVNFDIVLVVVMVWLQVEMDDDAEANNAADVLVQSDINTDGVLVMQEVKIVLFVLYNMCLLYAHSSHYELHIQTHTHTHPFNGPFSGTTQVSRYQKGKTNLDFTEARDSEWQWHQLGMNSTFTDSTFANEKD